MNILKQLKPSLLVLVIFTLVTGIAYPLIVTGVAQLAMPHQANGSLIVQDGKTVGSALIGQNFTANKYFWGRLSATGPYPYNAANSSGSNLGPLNPALADATKARIDALAKANTETGTAPGAKEVPIDLVTASGSGLDPHISLAAAQYQTARVAAARGLGVGQVAELVNAHTEHKWLSVFGDDRVNVLQLNLALDKIKT